MPLDFIRAAPGESLTVQITQDTVANRKPVAKGQVVDLPKMDALTLIGMGKAKKYVAPAPPPAPPAPAQTAADLPADPPVTTETLESSDLTIEAEEPRRRSKGKK